MRCRHGSGGGVGEAASFGPRELTLLDLLAELSFETAVESANGRRLQFFSSTGNTRRSVLMTSALVSLNLVSMDWLD